MRTKTPLVLMELLVMVLVFSLTAAACLRMFVLSDALSRQNAATDRAVLEAQTAAERMKRGSLNEYLEEQGAVYTDGTWRLAYDANWNAVSQTATAAYYLSVTYEDSEHAYLWSANIQVSTADGEELFSIPVSGQLAGGGTANA